MAQVFVTTYEAVGEGVNIMQEHVSAVRAYHERGLKVAQTYGARGFRPRHHSSPNTLMFDGGSAPNGFKLVKRDRPGVIECSPRMTTAIGREAKMMLDGVGILPSGDDAAAAFGWNPSMLAIDGTRGTVYFPTTLSALFPVERHFIRLPRFADDGWEQPPTLVAIAESHFMRAIEDHNAEAALRKSAA